MYVAYVHYRMAGPRPILPRVPPDAVHGSRQGFGWSEWEIAARNDPDEPWPPAKWQWPWGHVVTGNSPERFGELVASARAFLATQPRTPRAMVLNAWNEWTEGSVLLPTVDQGDAVLKALASALR